MRKPYTSGCGSTPLIFAILAYFGHPTWWLKGNHDGLGLFIVIPLYYTILAVISIPLATSLELALARFADQKSNKQETQATPSPARTQRRLQIALMAYSVIGLACLWPEINRSTFPTGLAYGVYVTCVLAQLGLFIATLALSRRLAHLLQYRPYVIPGILACSIAVSLVHYMTLPEPVLRGGWGYERSKEAEAVNVAIGAIVRMLLLAFAARAGVKAPKSAEGL